MKTFVGNYVKDVTQALTASAVSGAHVILIGLPGFGKTSVARRAAAAMVNGDHSFTRIDPTTPAERVLGMFDPLEALDGRLTRVTEGTPYAEGCRISILDELPRGNDPLLNACLDVLDRQDVDPVNAPTVWATANFIPVNDKLKALWDRFSLFVHLPAEQLSEQATAGIVTSHLLNGGRPELADPMPTAEQIEQVRTTPLTEQAIDAVIRAINLLKEEAEKENRLVTPRRVAQWTQILARYSAYLTGSHDFEEVPGEAMRILKYAWPALTEQQASEWALIASAAKDPVEAACEEALAMAYPEFKRVSMIQDRAERTAATADLGQVIQNAEGLLKALGSADPRIEQTLTTIDGWFGQAVRGGKVER